MNRVGTVAALTWAAWLVFGPSPVLAQAETPQLSNPNIAFDYYEPRNPAYMPLYDKLQKRKVLEELGRFLAPVHWPKKLRLIIKECPPPRGDVPEMSELVFFNGTEYTLNFCYQFFEFLEGLDPPPDLATPREAVVGGLVGAALREAGLAMFDMFPIPVLGSEDDAADQIAGFLSLQFGDETAQTVIKGTYAVWEHYRALSTSKMKPYDEAAKESLAPQRAYNLLCIAYGGDAAGFQELVRVSELPASRAEACQDEYSQVAEAFQATVLSKGYVDVNMIPKITSLTWITPGDLVSAEPDETDEP